MKYLHRNCPICGNDAASYGYFVEPALDKYTDMKNVQFPNYKCNHCDFEYFDTVVGLNDNPEILYGGLSLSPAEFEKRHYNLAYLITHLFPFGCNVLNVGGGNHDLEELLPDNYTSKNLDLFAASDCDDKRIYFDLVADTVDQRSEISNLTADIVILDNVLEHIAHFDNVRWLVDVIQPEYIYASVPNVASIKYIFKRSNFYRPVEHINSFNGKSLDKLFHTYGYNKHSIIMKPKSLGELFDYFFQFSIYGFSLFGLYRLYKIKRKT